jgi:hypothetical protein
MALHPQIVTMTCTRCGKTFKGDPRSQPLGRENYCSIACEEGKSPLPPNDPSSRGFAQHVHGEPKALVGRTLVANGLKFCDYSPEWHRTPDDYTHDEKVWVDRKEEEMVVKSHQHLGRVADYDGERGAYYIEAEDMETGEVSGRWWDESLVVHQLKKNRWWAE